MGLFNAKMPSLKDQQRVQADKEAGERKKKSKQVKEDKEDKSKRSALPVKNTKKNGK